MFAPLYVSNYCINNCVYCGYKRDNKFIRRKLTQEEVANEVRILESIVMFAPLYVSNYCINNCVYCGYKRDNKFIRRKLTQEEVANEVRILESMGHKRLALEVG